MAEGMRIGQAVTMIVVRQGGQDTAVGGSAAATGVHHMGQLSP